MNMLDKNFETIDEAMGKLKDAVSLRNKMGGALYWNILNDDCVEIASKIIEIGGNQSEVRELLA